MRVTIILYGIAFLLFSLKGRSQDVHFSQFDQAPVVMNVAQTGAFNGEARFYANQRTQWRSVTIPYQTFALSAEVNHLVAKPWSFGLVVGNDVAGDSRYKTTAVQSAASYVLKERSDTFQLRWGGGLGLTSRGFDPNALYYDNQWNGLVYDPALPNNESYTLTARTYLTATTGIYAQGIWNDIRWNAGYALGNLTRPKQSFKNDANVVLDLRQAITLGARRRLNDTYEVQAVSLIQVQGKMHEWVFGGRCYYRLPSEVWQTRNVFAGVFRRTRDAAWFEIGSEYDNWRVGLSYDLNTSKLRPASTGKGGLELSICYLIPPKPKLGKLKEVCEPFF